MRNFLVAFVAPAAIITTLYAMRAVMALARQSDSSYVVEANDDNWWGWYVGMGLMWSISFYAAAATAVITGGILLAVLFGLWDSRCSLRSKLRQVFCPAMVPSVNSSELVIGGILGPMLFGLLSYAMFSAARDDIFADSSSAHPTSLEKEMKLCFFTFQISFCTMGTCLALMTFMGILLIVHYIYSVVFCWIRGIELLAPSR